jgi:hypothetical protein
VVVSCLFDNKALNLLNSQETCELDMRETEILFFLLVVIMIRSRKTGSVTMISYLSSGFTYAKGANLILFFLADPRLGLVYLICFLLQVFLFLPAVLGIRYILVRIRTSY